MCFGPQVIDDDGAGIVISRQSMTVTELGSQEIYNVRLSSEPRGFLRVVMEYEPEDFLLLVTPSVLAFGKDNWNQTFEIIVEVRPCAVVRFFFPGNNPLVKARESVCAFLRWCNLCCASFAR